MINAVGEPQSLLLHSAAPRTSPRPLPGGMPVLDCASCFAAQQAAHRRSS